MAAVVSFVDAIKSRYGAVDDTSYAMDAFLVGDSSRKRNKTWEMVGMEKTRQKQAQHSKLVHVVVREAGINVAQHHDAEIDEQQLVRVQELDLSLNHELTLPMIDVIVGKLPSLQVLQVTGVPLFTPLAGITAAESTFAWERLRKLVLNHTGFVRLDQIATSLALPKLEELHLDNNDITCLVEGQLPVAGWSLPLVHSLSLANNNIASWDASSGLQSALSHCFPALKKLYLTGNPLPDITDEDIPHISGFMSRLTLLCLNDNKKIVSPTTLTHIRTLCPALETFRITYAYLYPSLNESLARMLVVSSLPSITTLNRAAVRQKERTDSELFYVQRGLSETDEAKKTLWYPMTAELREKHKDVVLALIKDGETASSASGGAHVMLDLRFRCDGFEDCRKTVPSSLQIGKLKALLRTVFGLDPVHQTLGYWSGDAALASLPTPLDNELQSLAYFGVGTGSIVLVQDASLRR